MTIEERYLNCFIAMARAADPKFKAVWFKHLGYFEGKLRDANARDFREANSKAAN